MQFMMNYNQNMPVGAETANEQKIQMSTNIYSMYIYFVRCEKWI